MSRRSQLFDNYQNAILDCGKAIASAVHPLIRERHENRTPHRAAAVTWFRTIVDTTSIGRATYTFTTGHGTLDVTYDYVDDAIVAIACHDEQEQHKLHLRKERIDSRNPIRQLHGVLQTMPALLEALWIRDRGKRPQTLEAVERSAQQVTDAREQIRNKATPALILEALKDRDEELLTFLFQTERLISQERATEAAELYQLDDVFIQYEDDEVALLRPNRRPTRRGQRGFLIGVDDTGCFIHPIDVTLLPRQRRVTRQMIREAVGYTTEYTPSLRLDGTEQVRVQGDLCIERQRDLRRTDKAANIAATTAETSLRAAVQQALRMRSDELRKTIRAYRKDGWTDAVQLNLPVDNHLVIVPRGWVRGSTAREPIEVCIPIETTLTVIHDEHDVRELPVTPGVYEISLLPRGLQPPARRPRWR